MAPILTRTCDTMDHRTRANDGPPRERPGRNRSLVSTEVTLRVESRLMWVHCRLHSWALQQSPATMDDSPCGTRSTLQWLIGGNDVCVLLLVGVQRSRKWLLTGDTYTLPHFWNRPLRSRSSQSVSHPTALQLAAQGVTQGETCSMALCSLLALLC